MTTSSPLSKNDTAVLGALFDPESSLQNHARIDISLPPSHYNTSTLSQIQTQERTALRTINSESPTVSDLTSAIAQLDAITTSYPEYASAWNNRAQARRMLNDLSPSTSTSTSSPSAQIFSDLAQAISLATPSSPTGMTTPSHASVLASAHTHRGYLLLLASRSPTRPSSSLHNTPYESLDREQLEELASRDFAVGGRYGNGAARELAVKTNPYAKLCGSIVREALQKEIRDFYGEGCEMRTGM